jgi:hypothetical protein
LAFAACGDNGAMRGALAVAVVLLAGCGAPQDPAKQADEVHSVAAEGALLAHEASENSVDTFTSEHAQALRKLLGQVRPEIEDLELARRADAVDAALARLADHPGDRRRAAALERRLETLAG